MRLEKIKLAGFKSFVDPTSIPLSGKIVGIVGPNGCGKSNIIDAVRWVMGESSAKHLRGDSMADVIFNGSASRKQVAAASVELIFDNRHNPIGGEYAGYNSIAVKRQIARDGQSFYFLNNTRCRRKDVTGIFLGTGVGSRSYAIIEQGTISRLIEAKPEELRQYLEEAAGISKYKERRRETELRIRHTRENLERLGDLRDEVSKQLNHLERQAKKAEKYTALKKDERDAKRTLLAQRWHIQDDKYRSQDKGVESENEKLTSLLDDLNNIDTEQSIVSKEVKQHQQVLNDIQREFYSVGSEIGRLEHSIQHAEASQEEITTEISRLKQQNEQANVDVAHDIKQLTEIKTELNHTEQDLEQAYQAEKEALDQQAQAIREQQEWQLAWDTVTDKLAGYKEQSEVQRTRIDHLNQRESQLNDRHQHLNTELQKLSDETLTKEIADLNAQVNDIDSKLTDTLAKIDKFQQQSNEVRENIQHFTNQLNEKQIAFQKVNGKISSLELLQKNAMGRDRKGVQPWLKQMKLENSPRLAQHIEVDSKWEKAVEIVLDTYLEAICLQDVNRVFDGLDAITDQTLAIFDARENNGRSVHPSRVRLVDQITSPWQLDALLAGIFCADTLGEAKSLLPELDEHESVITPDGLWIGPTWILLKNQNDEKSGVLSREKALRDLRKERNSLQSDIVGVEDNITTRRATLQQIEAASRDTQIQFNSLNAKKSDVKAQLSAAQARREEMLKRLKQIKAEVEEVSHLRAINQQLINQTRNDQVETEKNLTALRSEKLGLSQDNEKIQSQAVQINDDVRRKQIKSHELKSRIETLKSTETLTQTHLQRAESQSQDASLRLQDFELKKQSLSLMDSEKAQLNTLKDQRSNIERKLQHARSHLSQLEEKASKLAESKILVEREVEAQRERIEKARVDIQTAVVWRQTIEEQILELGVKADEILGLVAQNTTEAALAENLEKIGNQIERLGPINLIAVEEHESQSQRLDFLNGQFEDLIESLETLESAIKKIDDESKARFKQTFDHVNKGLQTKFPKLFGGGEAHLALCDDNLIDAGITVIAHPPGKKASTIHLLSGGEKALTAVALVFSLFELNPAPFCMLDEVDAPLDDANIDRFCQLLLEMSKQIQFVFISHNKITMEIAEHLTGVTMNEPGVSRLVAVDIDEAVKMAV